MVDGQNSWNNYEWDLRETVVHEEFANRRCATGGHEKLFPILPGHVQDHQWTVDPAHDHPVRCGHVLSSDGLPPFQEVLHKTAIGSEQSLLQDYSRPRAVLSADNNFAGLSDKVSTYYLVCRRVGGSVYFLRLKNRI